jgi:hypothetical protein
MPGPRDNCMAGPLSRGKIAELRLFAQSLWTREFYSLPAALDRRERDWLI